MRQSTATLLAELEKANALMKEAGFEDWIQFLNQHIDRLRRGDSSAIHPLWIAFAPTCEWDDLAIREMPESTRARLCEVGQAVFEAVERVEAAA